MSLQEGTIVQIIYYCGKCDVMGIPTVWETCFMASMMLWEFMQCGKYVFCGKYDMEIPTMWEIYVTVV